MLAKGTACKVGTGIAAPGKAEDEQDKEHRIIAVLLHRQQLLEPDKGIEAENHDAGEHQQAAGLLIADGAVAHHQIDGVKRDQQKGHRHHQPPHDLIVARHDQQRIRHQNRIHQPVLLFKAEGTVDLVDGDQRNGRDDQIKDQGVEGEHHADQYDDAHDRSNNTCFHRLDLLFTGRVPHPSGLSLAPAKPPGRPVPAPRAGGLGFTVRQTGGNDG